MVSNEFLFGHRLENLLDKGSLVGAAQKGEDATEVGGEEKSEVPQASQVLKTLSE